jgi:predicted aconitase with swiveling domain
VSAPQVPFRGEKLVTDESRGFPLDIDLRAGALIDANHDIAGLDNGIDFFVLSQFQVFA